MSWQNAAQSGDDTDRSETLFLALTRPALV